LQDCGRRANELEFEALTKIWDSFVDAWLKTQQTIVEYMSFPDLDNLPPEDLAAFLDSTELSEAQRKQVASAPDKKEMYSKILRLRTSNAAGAAIYEGRQILRTSGIYISSPTTNLEKAQTVFAEAIKHRPRITLAVAAEPMPTRHSTTFIRCVELINDCLAARDLLFERGPHQRGNHGNAKSHRNRSEKMNRV
jgi:hypothetical protein